MWERIAALALGLTPLVSRMIRKMTLNVTGTVAYTPQPPGFLSGPQDAQDPYIRGIQAFRTQYVDLFCRRLLQL